MVSIASVSVTGEVVWGPVRCFGVRWRYLNAGGPVEEALKFTGCLWSTLGHSWENGRDFVPESGKNQ